MKHFINFSNGRSHMSHVDPSTMSICRIESTACEQGHWDKVIIGAGPDLLYHIANGQSLVFHDTSEKNRQTRAFWQGVSFIQFCATVQLYYPYYADLHPREWFLRPRYPQATPINVFPQFWENYKALPAKIRNELKYFSLTHGAHVGTWPRPLGTIEYCGGLDRNDPRG